ncbi:MAG: phage major capsid protein [Ruminococcus sp.]|nr:phage major capsid protein [Ruminococcus sp.]
MGLITETSTLFKPELVTEIFNKVKGHSSLAKLCGATPIPFAGTDAFIFSMDGEACIVGEGGNKPANEATLKPVTIKPIKFIYQHRITDEFLNIAAEKRLPYMRAFTDGAAKKMARALDIAGFHGVNPYDGQASGNVGDNNFDTAVVKTLTFNASTPDDDIDDAVALIQQDDGETNGVAMSAAFGAALGKMKTSTGAAIYPEYRFGGNPASFAGGIESDVNTTVDFNAGADEAIVGDFKNAFKWGYAENVKFEIITTGDPDGLGDLKRRNQICLRMETYIGWGILDPDSFARIVNTTPFAAPEFGFEVGNTELFGVKASAMQDGLTVTDGKVTGTLKYLSTANDITNVWGKGNFIPFKLTCADWSKYESVMVGVVPSQGTGMVDIKPDNEHNGIVKIADKDIQRFKVVAKSADGKQINTQWFDLTGLHCNQQ